MDELIRTNLSAYAFVAAFTGLMLLSIISVTFKNTKNINNKKIKTVLRVGISSVLICLWAWHFIYVNLYPISLACYEYNHNIVEEKIGVINSIEQDGKDRIDLIIDNTEYRLVHSSTDPAVIIGKDIAEGDTVRVTFGAKSKYVFDIYKSNTKT